MLKTITYSKTCKSVQTPKYKETELQEQHEWNDAYVFSCLVFYINSSL